MQRDIMVMDKMQFCLPRSLVLICWCLLGASSQALNAGNCPNPDSTARFDLSQHGGVWYTIQRTEPLWSEFGASCVQVNFSRSEDGNIEAVWTAKAWIISSERTWTDELTISEDDPSKLLKNGDFSQKYNVIESDNAEYLVLYSCNQYISNFFYGEEIRILGRFRTMSRDTVMNIQRKLKNKGLHPKTLTYVDQTECN